MGHNRTIRERKGILRRQVLEARRLIPAAERTRGSTRIWVTLTALPAYKEADVICCFISYGEEVETVSRVRDLLQMGRRLAVPVMGTADGRPAFSEILAWDELSPNTLGILEPREEHRRFLPARALPFYLIPGVAFDPAGRRLGYGLGYYDRALENASSESLLVGLAFEVQIVDEVPVTEQDIPVDMIITEQRVIKTSARSRSIEEVC